MNMQKRVVLICSEVMSMKQNTQMMGKFHISRASPFFFFSAQSVLLQMKGGERVVGPLISRHVFYRIYLQYSKSYYFHIRVNI